MNTCFKSTFLILFLLTAGFLVSADAQRDRNNNGGQRGNSYSGRNGGDYSNRNNSSFDRQRNTGRSNDFNRQNNTSRNYGSYDRTTGRNRNYDWNRANQNSSSRRDVVTNNSVNRDVSRNGYRNSGYSNAQRMNRTVVVNNNVRFNSYNRYPTVYNYNRRGGYSFVRYNYYAPRRYVYVGAPRYSILPRSFITIRFGGYPYYYHGGCFYSYYDNYYAPVFAPIGIRVNILPPGFFSVYVGPSLYYYYEGIYYRKYQDRNNEYEVVDAPMGAVVSSLPKGATAAVVNGEKFYEFNGTYYKEGTNSKNEVVYTVVGKNGNINNTEEPASSDNQAPQIGDEITTLPENSRQVTINGEVLYLTPDNLYLKAETNNDSTTYKVVGKSEK